MREMRAAGNNVPQLIEDAVALRRLHRKLVLLYVLLAFVARVRSNSRGWCNRHNSRSSPLPVKRFTRMDQGERLLQTRVPRSGHT